MCVCSCKCNYTNLFFKWFNVIEVDMSITKSMYKITWLQFEMVTQYIGIRVQVYNSSPLDHKHEQSYMLEESNWLC